MKRGSVLPKDPEIKEKETYLASYMHHTAYKGGVEEKEPEEFNTQEDADKRGKDHGKLKAECLA